VEEPVLLSVPADQGTGIKFQGNSEGMWLARLGYPQGIVPLCVRLGAEPKIPSPPPLGSTYRLDKEVKEATRRR